MISTLTNLKPYPDIPFMLFKEFMDGGGNWDDIGNDFAEDIGHFAPEGVPAAEWAADFASCATATDPAARKDTVRVWLMVRYPAVMKALDSCGPVEMTDEFITGVASVL